MKTTYTGSCHCGAIEYRVALDLAAGTTRCNCTFCAKARFWMAFVPLADLEVLRGADAMTDYRHIPAGKSESFLHLYFCGTCGVRPFTRGGHLPALGGEFYAVNVATLDVPDTVLAAAPIAYADGRHGDWSATPAETRHL